MFENLFGTQTQVDTKQSGNLFANLFADQPDKKGEEEKSQIRIIDFPPALGGGQFKVDGTGSVVATPRGYADMSTKEQNERDHIISVALGGTSNRENLQYLKTTEEGRQEGKVSVEQEAINDYLNGKITLTQARTKVAMKQQQIQGLAPSDREQTVAGQLWPGLKQTFGDIFGGIKKGIDYIVPNEYGLDSSETAQSTPSGFIGPPEFEFKIGEGLNNEPIKLAPGPTRDLAALTPEERKRVEFQPVNEDGKRPPTELPEDVKARFALERSQNIARQEALSGQYGFYTKDAAERGFRPIGLVLLEGEEERTPLEKIADYVLPTAGAGAAAIGVLGIMKKTKNIANLSDDILRRIDDVTPNEIKIMEDFVDNTRLRKPMTPDEEVIARRLADEFNISPEQINSKLANEFETVLQEWSKIDRPLLPSMGDDIAKAKGSGNLLGDQRGAAQLPEFMQKAGESINPVRNQDPVVQDIYKIWTRELLVGEQRANNLIGKIPKVSDNFKTILNYEKGVPTKYTNIIKREFDALFEKANQAGLDIKYRKNYVPQVYQNTTEEVQEAMARYMKSKNVSDDIIDRYLRGIDDLPEQVSNRLQINPSFGKERAFPNYATAIEHGLTPKYQEPAQLLSHYALELDKTVANKKFLDNLIKNGLLKTAPGAKSGWQAVNLPFSPKGYYAEAKLARMLNGIFRNEEMLGALRTGLKHASNVAKTAQEIVLSAGVPKTNINFFAIGMGLVKEMTAGNFKSVVRFIQSNFNQVTIKHFAKNKEFLTMMAQEGIDMTKILGSHKTIYNKFKNMKGFAKKAGFIWDKIFQEKTFNSLMPMNYLDTFKDTYNRALKKMSPAAARKLAGDTVKAYHGLFENVGRGKGTEDFMSATLFAPKFREGLIHTLINTAKSVTTEIFNPAFRKNRKLIAGMIITGLGYNALNKKFSGHYMWDNPPGKEFELMIPTELGEEGDDVTYVPFMPSFLAFPRSIVSGGIAAAKGDASTAIQKFSGLASIPLKLVGELWANKDHFGREIYDPDADAKTVMKQMAGYVFGFNSKGASGGINHPFIREIYNQIFTDKPLYQSVTEALEIPLKFSSMTNIEKGEFYEGLRKKEAEDKKIKEEFKPRYDEVQTLLEAGKIEEATALTREMTPDEYKVYESLKRSDANKDRNDMDVKVFPTYKLIQELLAQGNIEKAIELTKGMTKDEYKAYKRLKNKLQ